MPQVQALEDVPARMWDIVEEWVQKTTSSPASLNNPLAHLWPDLNSEAAAS